MYSRTFGGRKLRRMFHDRILTRKKLTTLVETDLYCTMIWCETPLICQISKLSSHQFFWLYGTNPLRLFLLYIAQLCLDLLSYIWLRYYQGRYDSSCDIRSDECCVYNDKSTSTIIIRYHWVHIVNNNSNKT